MSNTNPNAGALAATLNDLPETVRLVSVALLNQTLADVTDLWSQSKQAHWNARGPLFYEHHEVFDKVADMFFEELDEVAERIVTLGGIANGTVRAAAANSALPEFPTNDFGSLAYIKALASHTALAAKRARAAIDTAANAGDADTADLLTGISRALDKALWFIEAHTR
ncbi:MAG: DNA starvation/stationary phase protection protein Dps [Puniceicoccales bacterium]|jgi:starvation-inducible DNA-binding protein|nr:DNA starvation/stationary phase protection protein Dps [Puniceicoccales bacterium]